MKSLILTEKPSVARDFAKALGVNPKGSGFFESERYIITWAIGHLLELKAPEDYRPEWKKWSMASLPILPDRLSYKINDRTKKQFHIVNKQLKRHDYDEVIIATDAGREGELIARTLLDQASVFRPCFRFWTSQALGPSVIKSNMQKLRPLEEYDRLYYAGRARQSADWLVGMNLSRLATLKMGDLFSIGRVQTAVLSLLVQRRKEIDNFKPSAYFVINGEFSFNKELIKAKWFNPELKENTTHIPKKELAQAIVDKCQGKDVLAKSVKKEIKKQPSPMLFSLTELQRVANRRFGFSAKKTLGIAQSLYEKYKCLSYPRTDARVLGSKSLGQSKKIVEMFKEHYPKDFKYFDDNKLSLKNRLVFNDAKLTDHHALMPLKMFKGNPNSDEGKIYHLVRIRFISAFLADFKYEETRLKFLIEDENFKTSGQTIICLGWKDINYHDKEEILPSIKEGEIGNVNKIERDDRETKPPAEYNEASLLQDMINPSRLVDEKQMKKIFRGEVGLGTQATRAQIIETLLQRKYVQRKGKQLIAQVKGVTLIKALDDLELSKVLCSPKETAKWELDLTDIAQGEGDVRKFMINIRQFIADCTMEWKGSSLEKVRKDVIQNKRDQKNFKNDTSSEVKEYTKVGVCPLCKKSVLDFPKSFGCEGWKEGCKFTIWKKMAGKSISITQAKKLMSKGKSDKLKGFKSKAGKKFDASLKVDQTGVSFDFT